jgi:hypothetical protein
MPGLIRAADVTQVLRQQGYWASYNVPYFEDIFKASGNEDMVRTNGLIMALTLLRARISFAEISQK